jgi:ParB family chromosome partitioning protein
MEKKARLGRGLDALLGDVGGEAEPAAGARESEVAVGQIDHNPYQPRKNFDDEELARLGDSIKAHGVLQPLVVRPVGERFQLVAGERRLRAAQAAGLSTVPVRVVDFNDQQVLEAALVENIQRTDLNPIEKAQGFKEYLDRYQMRHEELAARLGLARPTVSNLVGLLELPAEVQEAVRTGQLSNGHAKVLKGLNDPERQVALCKEIISRGLSVHAAEAMIKQQQQELLQQLEQQVTTREPRPAAEKTPHVQGIEDELRQKLALRVEIRPRGKDRGQIVLTFDSNDDFERVVEVLRK